jgi:hypothetical protein
VLQVPVMGLEETMLYPTLWLYILGAVNASRENTHIRANVLEIFLTTRQHARCWRSSARSQPGRGPVAAHLGVGLHALCLAGLARKPDPLHPDILCRHRAHWSGMVLMMIFTARSPGPPLRDLPRRAPQWLKSRSVGRRSGVAADPWRAPALVLRRGDHGDVLRRRRIMSGNMLWGFQQLGNPVLLAIPLFVLAGTIMSESGIAASCCASSTPSSAMSGRAGRGRRRLCAVIGAISGSGLTGIAAIGPLLIPEMEKRGYPRAYATALIANSSILGLLIPPSVTMIVYGWVTDTSILACFLATLGPGLLIMVAFSVDQPVMARKFPLKLDDKPNLSELTGEVAKRGAHAFPALLMPVIILGGIYGGVMTPTEAAAVAVIYAIPVGFLIYQGLALGQLARCRQGGRHRRRRDHADDPVLDDPEPDVRDGGHPAEGW